MTVIIGFFVLLVLGVPIFAVVMMCASAGLVLFTPISQIALVQQLFNGLDTTTLLAVPFFIVAGSLAARGKTSEHLINVFNVIFGWMPGGPIIATIATCAFFAAISGSSMATVVAVGTIMIPALKEEGYPEKMNVGCVCSAGSLGIMIPPSAPMVMFCVAMGTSVGKQFMAGFIPGLLIAFCWMVYAFFTCKIKGYGKRKKYSFGEAARIFLYAIPALIFPLLVLGSIYLGWATPTEAAAISVVYILILEFFVYKTMTFRKMFDNFYEGFIQSAGLLIIVGTATALSYVITINQIPNLMVEVVSGIVSSRAMLIVVLMLMLFIAGCFIDTIPLIVILAPILVPLLNIYEVDLIHFGIMAVIAAQVGYITPPFGTNLFITMGVAQKPFGFVARSIVPFVIILACVGLLISLLPQLTLWLPGMMNM